MKYRVSGQYTMTYYLDVDKVVEAQNSEEAVALVADGLSAGKGYSSECDWINDSPTVTREGAYSFDLRMIVIADSLKTAYQKLHDQLGKVDTNDFQWESGDEVFLPTGKTVCPEELQKIRMLVLSAQNKDEAASPIGCWGRDFDRLGDCCGCSTRLSCEVEYAGYRRELGEERKEDH